jgi:hypothetical protein
MTPDETNRSWDAIPKPMLIGLSQSQSEIGRVLRQLPAWLLQEADRREQQDWEGHNRRQRHSGSPLPWPDPWQFLIDTQADVIPREIKRVYRAAQSQLCAMKLLASIGLGTATLNNDWQDEAEKAQKPVSTPAAVSAVVPRKALGEEGAPGANKLGVCGWTCLPRQWLGTL